jgi:hypothetical protein
VGRQANASADHHTVVSLGLEPPLHVGSVLGSSSMSWSQTRGSMLIRRIAQAARSGYGYYFNLTNRQP